MNVCLNITLSGCIHSIRSRYWLTPYIFSALHVFVALFTVSSLFSQGTILGAFYYGYTAMQIPGGWLGQRFGGTRVFGICLGIASILTMLTPIAARTSVAALITLRVIEGLALVSYLI